MKPPMLPGLFPVFDAREAERLKSEGVSAASENPRTETWRETVGEAIVELARGGRNFTSDDVYALADAWGTPLPDGLNMGSSFVGAHRGGLIVPVWCPSVKSKRAASHARTVKVWKGAES